MESSKNAKYKKSERMNFFEKMAMIEPRIESNTRKAPPKESKPCHLSRRVKQKSLLERIASSSPNNSPRSQSRSPSPSVSSHVSDQSAESNATLRATEFRNPNLSVTQGTTKLENIIVHELNKSSLSSQSFIEDSSAMDKNISNEGEIITSETVIVDEVSTYSSTAPVSLKSSNKLGTQTTSGTSGSRTHINTSEITQIKENDRSSPKQFSTAHPITAHQKDNMELRKSPFVYLEIMQKEMIDKHMSSPSSSPKTNEKQQQVPSRAKLKEIAKCSPKSSPRSSPKLVKKPFRRSSVKNVSDSQVENALQTKNAKTPTKSSAVSPVKNETTLSKSSLSDNLLTRSKEPTNTSLVKFSQSDDTSSTHSSVDQEIVQIIPRFAAESGHNNEHDLREHVNRINNAEGTQSVDSLEMSSSAPQLPMDPTFGCRSVSDINEELTTTMQKEMNNKHVSLPTSSPKTNEENQLAPSKAKTSDTEDLTHDVEDDTNLRVPSVSSVSETNPPDGPTEQVSAKLAASSARSLFTRRKSIEPVVNNVLSTKVEKKLQLIRKESTSGETSTTDTSIGQDTVTEVSMRTGSTRLEDVEKNSSLKRCRTLLHQKRGPRPRSKSPKGKESNTGVSTDSEKKGSVNDAERLLGTVTRSGRKVKMSAVALEALEAATIASDDDDHYDDGADEDKSVTKHNAQERLKERCPSPGQSCSVSQHKTVVSPAKSKTLGNPSTDPRRPTKSLIPESPTRSSIRVIPTVAAEKAPVSFSSTCSSARNTRSSTVVTTETGSSTSSGTTGEQANMQPKESDSKNITSPQGSKVQTRRSVSNTELVLTRNDSSQIQSEKESASTQKKDVSEEEVEEKEKNSRLRAKNTEKSPKRKPSVRKEKLSPKELQKCPSPKERKGSLKRSPNSKGTDAGECRVTRGRSKALASLITQVEDRLKTPAPVPKNLQLETNPADHSESFLSGGSSSEESGSSDDQIEDDDDDAGSLNLHISDNDVRTPSPHKHSNVHETGGTKCSEPSNANALSIRRRQTVGNSTESSDKEHCPVEVPFESYRENRFASDNKKQSTCSKRKVEMKEICDHPAEINKKTFELEKFHGNDQASSETGGNQLSVFEAVTDDDGTSSAFISDKLEKYLVKDRNINQTLKNDPYVYKPLSPPTKFTGVQNTRESPQKQFNSNPDVDDMDGVKLFSYASAKELCMHVDREKAIISEWNCDPENEESPVLFHRSGVLSPEKTNDPSLIKGWRNKSFSFGNRNVENSVPKLRYFAARGLVRKLKSEEITELGLRLKARRRRSPVLLHQKSKKTGDVETKTSINIYGRRRDGRFATKRSVWPKKAKGK